MAAKRVTDRGRQLLLDIVNGITAGPIDVDYCLFQTNITPTENDVNATYTAGGIEATFSGYARIRVTGWAASVVVSNKRVSYATPITFTVAGLPGTTNQIYGYFAVIHGTNNVLWAMAFDGSPYPMTANGNNIVVTPELDYLSEFA